MSIVITIPAWAAWTFAAMMALTAVMSAINVYLRWLRTRLYLKALRTVAHDR